MASKVSVYSIPDLKATTDEALATYLTHLGVTQSFFRQDVRLALGYSLVLIGGGTFYLDRKFGPEASKEWMILAVLAYFSINGLFSLWVWFIDQGIVFEGTMKGGRKITISSNVERYDPTYRLTITTSHSSSSTSSSSSSPSTVTIAAPFSRWFTPDGTFGTLEFQEWITDDSIEIGKLETRKFVRAKVSTETSRITELMGDEDHAQYGASKEEWHGNRNGQQPIVLDGLDPTTLEETLKKLKETGTL